MASGLQQAIAEIIDIVGAANVIHDADEIETRTRDISLWKRLGAAIVYPGTAEEVAGVVKIAAAAGLAVWPFSKGKNWGYGATMPFRDGAIILVLERLNRIIEVNEELAYAVIEPGVTQQQLNDHLKSRNIPLWADCTDSTPHGSVIGNALERGVGYTPYWDHFGHLCGLEVVLASGEIIRTGGGPPDSRTWNTYKWGTGPFVDGLFSQGNFGIVTKAGLWLMPQPDAFGCFVCELDDDSKRSDAIDALRRLALSGALPANVHVGNDIIFAAQLGQYPYDLLDGRTYLSSEGRQRLRERLGTAAWTVAGGLYGSPAQIRIARSAISVALGSLGKLTFLDDRRLRLLGRMTRVWKKARRLPLLPGLFRWISGSSLEKAEAIPQVYSIMKGVPGEFILGFAYFKSRQGRPAVDLDPARDGAGMMWLALLCPMTGRDTSELLHLCETVFNKHGFDLSVVFIMVNPRSTLALMQIFYDKQDDEEGRRALTLYDEITEATRQAGFQQYRTSVFYGDRIMAASAGLQRFLDAMHGAADPHRVIAPGRYGVGLPNDAPAPADDPG